jgi:hypothetical protein
LAWRALADVLLIAHAAFVAFVMLGGLLAMRWPRLAWVHLPAAAWGAWVEFSQSICPLTPWEQAARLRAGEAGWEGGFVEHYLLRLIYPDGLTAPVQWGLGALVLLVNAAIYGALIRRRRRWPSR